MAEFNEVNAANEVQKEVSAVRSEGAGDGNEETVVKIKLLEESVSLQVPVEERSVEDNDVEQVEGKTGATHVNSNEKEGEERYDKETARKEKRRQRREKRREREKSKGSTSDENDINGESSFQEKKAKIETGDEEIVEKDRGAEGGDSEKGGERMEVQDETSLTVNLAGSSFTAHGEPLTQDGTGEAEIDIIQSEQQESVAEKVRALLEANMDGEMHESSEKDPEAEQRAKEEREKRAEEVLAAMNFENDEKEEEPDLQTDDAPARESVEEFFVAQETRKIDIHLQLMLSPEDSEQGMARHEGGTTHTSEEDKDAKLEELFSSENATDSREDEEGQAGQVGNPVEEMMVAQLQRETHVQPQVWQLADDDHGPEVNGGTEEPVALSEEEKERKLKELFEEEAPKDGDSKEDERSELQAPAEEAEVTADCQHKVEAGVDLSVLDAKKSSEPTHDEGNDDSLEGKEESTPQSAKEGETGETEPFSDVHESVEEYVSVPERKLDLCLDALSSGEELSADEGPAEEAQRSAEKEPPKDLDSLFVFHSEPETKKGDGEGKEQQTVALGEDVQEEEIREERKASDVECAWDMSFFDEPEKDEDPEKDEAGEKLSETPEAETKTTETISSETHEKFTESKTTYTTSIVMKPVSPTLRKSAPALETADTAQPAPGEAETKSTVTTTLETIMITKVTPSDSTTGEPQVVLRRGLKKEIEDAFEPLPDKESEGTAPLAQVEGTGLEGSEDDLLERTTEGIKSGSEKEPLIEKAPKEEEPGDEEKKPQGEEPEVETKKPDARDEEQLIPEEKKKKGRGPAKCCVLQ